MPSVLSTPPQPVKAVMRHELGRRKHLRLGITSLVVPFDAFSHMSGSNTCNIECGLEVEIRKETSIQGIATTQCLEENVLETMFQGDRTWYCGVYLEIIKPRMRGSLFPQTVVAGEAFVYGFTPTSRKLNLRGCSLASGTGRKACEECREGVSPTQEISEMMFGCFQT